MTGKKTAMFDNKIRLFVASNHRLSPTVRHGNQSKDRRHLMFASSSFEKKPTKDKKPTTSQACQRKLSQRKQRIRHSEAEVRLENYHRKRSLSTKHHGDHRRRRCRGRNESSSEASCFKSSSSDEKDETDKLDEKEIRVYEKTFKLDKGEFFNDRKLEENDAKSPHAKPYSVKRSRRPIMFMGGAVAQMLIFVTLV